MFMRFGRRGPNGGVMQGELRFAFERRTTHGVERVRLTRMVSVAYDPAIKARLEAAGSYVMANVAIPRRRTHTEATAQNIIAVLNSTFSGSNNDWQLLNPSRVFRRRRTSPRPTYRTMYGDSANAHRHTIHSYSHKPSPRFKVGGGEADGTAPVAFFGIELEIDQQGSTMLDRYAVPDLAHPLFYCKEDGSLDNGVEMVSHPGTAKWWQEQRGNVEVLLQRLSQMGWRSHETKTCGMHVHVSNTAFENSMHIYRFLHLIYRYPTLALLVSQRERRRLNQWATLRYSKKPQLKQKANVRLKGREWMNADSAGHYDAVNKTAHTLELRIFNGTLNPSRFYKNLQFAEAAVRFTADTLNLRKVNALRFAEYVAANAEKYPDLASFLAEHSGHAALTNKRADKKALGFSEAA